jgi:hypothetical protein
MQEAFQHLGMSSVPGPGLGLGKQSITPQQTDITGAVIAFDLANTWRAQSTWACLQYLGHQTGKSPSTDKHNKVQ